jgi:hypothetical protein
MKLIAGIVLTFLLGAMFMSLFHMSVGMDMSGSMTDCPFMSHGEVICPMNLADHIGAWMSVFASFLPTVTLLLGFAGVVVFIASVAPNLLRRIKYTSPPLYRGLKAKTYTFSYRLLQEMFSNGILNPKVF